MLSLKIGHFMGPLLQKEYGKNVGGALRAAIDRWSSGYRPSETASHVQKSSNYSRVSEGRSALLKPNLKLLLKSEFVSRLVSCLVDSYRFTANVRGAKMRLFS